MSPGKKASTSKKNSGNKKNLPATTNENANTPAESDEEKEEKEEKVNLELVETAYEKISGIVHKYYSDAMYEVGEYLIKEFYANDYKRVYDNKPVNEKSLNQLNEKIKQNKGDAPSKTWIYNAVAVVADERYYREIGFSVYGKLGKSHKVYLTHVNDKDEKKKLIEEAVKNNYTVAQLRAKIAELKINDGGFSLERLTNKTELLSRTLAKLNSWKKKTDKDIKNLTETLKKYEKGKEVLVDVIQEKELEKQKKDEEKQKRKQEREE